MALVHSLVGPVLPHRTMAVHGKLRWNGQDLGCQQLAISHSSGSKNTQSVARVSPVAENERTSLLLEFSSKRAAAPSRGGRRTFVHPAENPSLGAVVHS